MMSCRFARTSECVIGCDLLARGGWQQLAALEQLRAVGITAAANSEDCPVAQRGQWTRCPCRRAVMMPAVAPVRL